MDRLKAWAHHLGFAALMAGALLSRDMCFGGARPPPPEPEQEKTATAATATAAPSPEAPATPEPSPGAPAATAAPSSTFAAPP